MSMLPLVDALCFFFFFFFFFQTIGQVASSVDPDQTPRSAASDQGLHCLLRLLYPTT